MQLIRFAGSKPVSAIAKLLDRSFHSVKEKAKAEKICLYQGTYTACQVAKHLRCNERTVWNLLKRLKISVPRRRYQNRGYAMISDEQLWRLEDNFMGKKWSSVNSFCINCGRNDRKHHAYGLCLRCYERDRTFQNEAQLWHIRLRAFFNQLIDAIDNKQLDFVNIKNDSGSARCKIDFLTTNGYSCDLEIDL